MAAFLATVGLSAFLLFLVQPVIAEQILPWFGGSAAVWSICMVFFQVLLLAGYAYADWVSRRLAPRRQMLLHAGLLLLSLAFLPIVADPRWKPAGDEDPTLWILGLLGATIGLPYFLLSTTGPLVQSWVARTLRDARVYRYFSLSNLASLAALVCYPFLIEPRARLLQQAWAWSAVYALFVVLCAAAAWYFARHADGPPAASDGVPAGSPAAAAGPAPGWREQLLWLCLSALGSGLLLAVTNHITQNVAAIPFLWLLPLVLYLLTFVLCFESDRWYRRSRWIAPVAALLLLCAYGLQDSAIGGSVRIAIPLYALGLFALCMFLHGELAQRRPATGHLTRFYLMLSLGGAVGGILVGLVAPRVLPAYYELGLAFVLAALVAAWLFAGRRALAGAALATAAACAWCLGLQVQDDLAGARRFERNFYGTLLTVDVPGAQRRDDVRQLYHGSVKHGEQYLAPERSREPTTYYGASSGIGRTIAQAPAGERRIGLIGLGAGVLATYGRAGDALRFYEINPAVLDVARDEFSFMRDSRARLTTVIADARLALEREPAQGFHVLAVDAFSGDSVPVHLLTVEAMRIYLRHLHPDGVVAFHLTNRFLWLPPVVQRIAAELGLATALVHDAAADSDLRRTDWMLVARNPAVLQRSPIREAVTPLAPAPAVSLWSDDFNNLFEVLK